MVSWRRRARLRQPARRHSAAGGECAPAWRRWVDCACGRKHWGTNGASGILLARRDSVSGKVTHVVMQHRAAWSAEGGTWGIPGGATADGESPIEGALRESYEEANITPEDIEVVAPTARITAHGPTPPYSPSKSPATPLSPRPTTTKAWRVCWVPIDDRANRKLLTAMKTDWPPLPPPVWTSWLLCKNDCDA